ncbi:energy transducer TonB [Roseateles sp. P5_E7]
MSAATLRPPEAAGIGRGLTFALIAHGLLILALSSGLNWRSDSSPSFEAELWSSVPTVAAPREEAPVEPEPEAPKPQPDTRAQQRAAEEAAAEQRDAEIAIAKDKKRKEDKAREDAAKLEKATKDKEAKDKAAKDKATKDEQDRKKLKDDKTAKDVKEAKEAKDADARREAQRLENLRRIQGMAGGTPGSSGNAAQNSGPSGDWISKVRTIVSKSPNFPEGETNPTVEIRVFLAPDGKILARKVIRPSADPAWDEAALRGIDKVGQLPRDGDKRLPEYLDLPMCPRSAAICPR